MHLVFCFLLDHTRPLVDLLHLSQVISKDLCLVSLRLCDLLLLHDLFFCFWFAAFLVCHTLSFTS